ncbi:RNA 2',3'-cyclic phosphodiesterase [Geobacter argillaceus]|uniref:RNA 2',3'-cyclic phosphodiesterase n=1 Tax=Geobacter argillaceus TaxID=345631 RepID=A0A562VFK0_9BACT|nr:RNA 2',3'-cyclic phosphodiesterase [Geobacter argillaceus]TWJ16581.1 2'-5' RNA ligase [Geobacter argillaceus]
MHRLFVAIDLPDEVKRELAKLRREEIQGARWVPVEQLHLTLRFIGEVDDATFEAIRQALGAVRGGQFPLAVQLVGHFPPRKSPHVLWVGADAGESLADLQGQVEDAVQTAGLAPEHRPFSPHITIARLRETPPHVVAELEKRHQAFACAPFEVPSFHLYESTLTGKGAIHTVVRSYPLSAPTPSTEGR